MATPALGAESFWRTLEQPASPQLDSATDCAMGAEGPAAVSAPTLPGVFEVCLLVEPGTECNGCPAGFDATSIRVMLEIDHPQACEINATTRLKSADLSDPSCPTPALGECSAGQILSFFVSPGLNELVFPTLCPCADPSFPYFICVAVANTTCDGVARTATFDPPGPVCTSYISDSNGRTDEASLGIPGVLSLTMTADCCQQPVPGALGSWGMLKGSFGH